MPFPSLRVQGLQKITIYVGCIQLYWPNTVNLQYVLRTKLYSGLQLKQTELAVERPVGDPEDDVVAVDVVAPVPHGGDEVAGLPLAPVQGDPALAGQLLALLFGHLFLHLLVALPAADVLVLVVPIDGREKS